MLLSEWKTALISKTTDPTGKRKIQIGAFFQVIVSEAKVIMNKRKLYNIANCVYFQKH
jgi:hypothetical protein